MRKDYDEPIRWDREIPQRVSKHCRLVEGVFRNTLLRLLGRCGMEWVAFP